MWWREEDSNLRSLRRQIYSLFPLAARESLQGESFFQLSVWSWRWDSNPQPADYKSAALPIELRQRFNQSAFNRNCLFKEKHGRCQAFFIILNKICDCFEMTRHWEHGRQTAMQRPKPVKGLASFFLAPLLQSAGHAPEKWKNAPQFLEASKGHRMLYGAQ